MKVYYKRHPLLVMLISVVLSIVLGIIVLSVFVLHKGKKIKLIHMLLIQLSHKQIVFLKAVLLQVHLQITQKTFLLVSFQKSM